MWCWRRVLSVPWTARRSKQSILKEINPEYSLEGLMLKLKLQYLSTWGEELTHQKRPWCWEKLKAGREGDCRGWNSWMASPLNGHEFEQAPVYGERWGSLVCCSPWGCKELDIIEWLNNNNPSILYTGETFGGTDIWNNLGGQYALNEFLATRKRLKNNVISIHYYASTLLSIISSCAQQGISKKKKKKKGVEQRKELTRFQEGMKENRDSWQFQKFVSRGKTTTSQP